jgi:hypothetical protein
VYDESTVVYETQDLHSYRALQPLVVSLALVAQPIKV